jgi:hypothetical protein
MRHPLASILHNPERHQLQTVLKRRARSGAQFAVLSPRVVGELSKLAGMLRDRRRTGRMTNVGRRKTFSLTPSDVWLMPQDHL